MHKVILFGLDGASFKLIEPWVKNGCLPAFAYLMREGTHSVLKSTYPPVTVPAWASMLTGKNPGRLGYYDFAERKSGSYHFGSVNLRWNNISPVWKLASDHGKQVCVFNIPTTPIPIYQLNGIFIAGPGPLELGLGKRWAVPERVNQELHRMHYQKTTSLPKGFSMQQILQCLQQQAGLQCQLATRFLTKEPWDFFAFCLFVTDIAGHLCLGKDVDISGLLDIYQIADRWLGDVLEHLPKGYNLIIVSDHGQTSAKRMVDLNSWLAEQGFLVTKPTQRRWLSRTDTYRLISRWGLYPLYKRLTANKLINQVDLILKSHIPWERHLLQETDWSRTQAYSISNSSVFVNLQGREPQGCVGVGEYDLLRKKLIAALKTFNDPETGKGIVRQVLRREEVYRGKFLEKMPDIVVEWEDGYSNIVSEGIPRYDSLNNPSNRFHGGVHTRDGIFIAWGPDIAKSKDIGSADIVSVAPTLLYLLGLPIPAGLDGQVLTEILCNPPSPTQATLWKDSKEQSPMEESTEEARFTLNRLREMGYLE